MNYLGDFLATQTVTFPIQTRAQTGAAVAPSSALEAADLVIYKNASATQRSSANGITMTSPFDSITGGHMVAIALTDDTDAGFWAAGNDYHVWLQPDETVDGLTIREPLVSFSIENRNTKANVVKQQGVDVLTPVTGTAQAGGSSNSIVLASGTTAAQCPVGSLIVILSGTGAFQAMKVASVSGMGGSTPTATGPTGWTWPVTNPGVSAVYVIVPDDGLIPVLATSLAQASELAALQATADDLGTDTRDLLLAAVIEGTTTLQQSLRLLNAVLGGKSSGNPDAAVFRSLADDKNRVSATLDVNGNRTGVTLDLT